MGYNLASFNANHANDDQKKKDFMAMSPEELREAFNAEAIKADQSFLMNERKSLEILASIVKKAQDIGLPVSLDTLSFRESSSVHLTNGSFLCRAFFSGTSTYFYGQDHQTRRETSTSFDLSSITQQNNLLETLLQTASIDAVYKKAIEDFSVPPKQEPVDTRRKQLLPGLPNKAIGHVNP